MSSPGSPFNFHFSDDEFGFEVCRFPKKEKEEEEREEDKPNGHFPLTSRNLSPAIRTL